MRGFLIRLGLVFFGVCLATVAAELFLRIIPNSVGYVDNGLIRIPWFSAEHDFDPEVGFWPKPNQAFRRTTECYDIPQVSLNSWGMRSAWKPESKTSQALRIAVFGDSFVQGLQVNDDEHFSAVLQKLLPGSEVLNFGVSSTGTIQQLLAYRKFAASLRPDIVVHALFVGNDLFDNSAVLEGCYTEREVQFERPYYTRDGQISLPSKQVPRRYYTHANNYWQQAHNFLTAHSFMYNAFVMLAPKVFHGLAATVADAPPPCPCWPFRSSLVPLGALTDPPDMFWEQAWKDTFRAIDEFREAVERNGSKYILMILPDTLSNRTQYLAVLEKEYPEIHAQQRNYEIETPVKRFEEYASTNQITFVSLLPRFKEYSLNHFTSPSDRAQEFGFRCDSHWNPLGHLLAAELVAETLIKEKVLPESYSARQNTLFAQTPQALLGVDAYKEIYENGVYHGASRVSAIK